MPVTPTYPGVYIEEVPSGVRTITNVPTSIAAFLGRTSKGRVNKAERILNLSDYERKFGEPFAKSDLAASVRRFFDNGGTDCYVVRLAKNAVRASVTLKSLGGQEVLNVAAKAEGCWANTVRVEIDYGTPTPDETFNMRVIEEKNGKPYLRESFTNLSMDSHSARYAPAFVTQSSQLVDVTLSSTLSDPANPTSTYNTQTFDGFSFGRRPLASSSDPSLLPGLLKTKLSGLIGAGQAAFQISVNDSPHVTVDLAATPAIPGTSLTAIGNNIADKIKKALDQLGPSPKVTCSFTDVANAGLMLRIDLADTDKSKNVSVRVKRASSQDISVALMLGVDQGGIEHVRWTNFRPAPTASILRLGDPTVAGSVDSMNMIAGLLQSAVDKIKIDDKEVGLSGEYSLATTAGAEAWHNNAAGESSATGDNDGVREKLRIIARAINDNAEIKKTHKAEVWGYHLAIIATNGTINSLPTVVTDGPAPATKLLFGQAMIPNVRQYTLGTGGTGAFSANGADGTDGNAPGYAEYIGSQSEQKGFYALDSVDLFNLMILPEDEEVSEQTMLSLWGPASTYCASRRAFLIVDSPKSWTSGDGRPGVVGETDKINDLRSSIVKDYSAVFYPRLRWSDMGLTKTVASGGAVAGLMARTDATRGVWKASAGIEAGFRNVLGVDVKLTDAENGVLNKKGVNCIRVFPNGIVNWGARTLDGDDDFGSEYKYIPIRRLALMIEESLYRGTRWVVFEGNDEPLWAKIRLNVGAYMMSLFRQGAFQGTNPKDAFFVKCDGETTPQDDINKGIVNIRVGFAPLKPAEFVIITIQQMTGKL